MGFLISDGFEHKPCKQALGQALHMQLEQNCLLLLWMHLESGPWGLKWAVKMMELGAGSLKVAPRREE